MKNYRLIKEYPSSPELGYVTNFNYMGEDWFPPNVVARGDCTDYPEFWEEVKIKIPRKGTGLSVTLPESQIALIKRGLDCIIPESWNEIDIITLKALTNYHVTISMSVEEYENFTASNGVDFPEYI